MRQGYAQGKFRADGGLRKIVGGLRRLNNKETKQQTCGGFGARRSRRLLQRVK
jgi:hypothetical protein